MEVLIAFFAALPVGLAQLHAERGPGGASQVRSLQILKLSSPIASSRNISEWYIARTKHLKFIVVQFVFFFFFRLLLTSTFPPYRLYMYAWRYWYIAPTNTQAFRRCTTSEQRCSADQPLWILEAFTCRQGTARVEGRGVFLFHFP